MLFFFYIDFSSGSNHASVTDLTPQSDKQFLSEEYDLVNALLASKSKCQATPDPDHRLT